VLADPHPRPLPAGGGERVSVAAMLTLRKIERLSKGDSEVLFALRCRCASRTGRSIDFGTGCLDDFPPLVGFNAQEHAKRISRQGAGFRANIGKPFYGLGIA
jgi:hypothetical protein